MSDAITDCERDSEKAFLSNIKAEELAKRLRELRAHVRDYESIKAQLIKKGYKVEEHHSTVKVWKEI